MKANLNIGNLLGTQVHIHWTFFLLMAWVILSETLSRGFMDTTLFDRILFNLGLVIAVMICVLFHEFGHLLVAKHYGIKTERMVLLPIGGMSVQEKSTGSPKEEFLMTIAGPAVNILIAILLFFAVPVRDYFSYDLGTYFNALNEFSIQTFLFYLFIINVALVVFNMIPAFPLDGGRVLRALLDVKLDRVRATSITATISHIIAILFLLIGLLFNPILIFMSLFLFIGSYTENKMVHQLRLLKGHIVKDAMLEDITFFHPDNTMDDIIKVIITGSETNFIVIKDKTVEGLLFHKNIIQNSNNKTLLVKDLMTVTFKTVQANDKLSTVYGLMQKEVHPFFPVMEEDIVVGAIDFANLHEFLLMQAKQQY